MSTLVTNDAMSQTQPRLASSISASLGAYASSGFGTNWYFGAQYNYSFSASQYFVEAAIGFSSVKSKVLESLSVPQLFDNERLFTYQFLFCIDGNPTGPIPHVALGVAGVNIGGATRFAGVVGLGKRVPLTGFLGSNQWGFRFDVRDLIYEQTINNSDPFITHNIMFTVGLQLYF